MLATPKLLWREAAQDDADLVDRRLRHLHRRKSLGMQVEGEALGEHPGGPGAGNADRDAGMGKVGDGAEIGSALLGEARGEAGVEALHHEAPRRDGQGSALGIAAKTDERRCGDECGRKWRSWGSPLPEK